MIRNNKIFDGVFCFIFVFFLIFGIKVGYIDLSVVIPFSILLLYFAIRRSIDFNKKLLIASILVAFLFVYQIIVQIIFLSFDLDSLLRLVRALLVCVLLAAMIGSRLFSSRQILVAIFYSLLFHAILIDIAAIFEPLNNFLAAISGNDRIKSLRASGFLAGFDISGLLSLFGMLMLLLKIYTPNSNLKLIIFYLVFVLGCFFTSRVSMALSIIFLCFFFFVNLLNSRKNVLRKILSLTIFIVVVCLFVSKYIVPIVEVTFSLGVFDVGSDLRDDIISRHAVQSEDSFLWADMFYLPDSFISTIFGTGIDEINSDVGYVKDIFRYGIVGLLFSFVIYIYI